MERFKNKRDCIQKAMDVARQEYQSDISCPICNTSLVRTAYQDVEHGWIIVWMCNCIPDENISIHDDESINIYVWNKQLKQAEEKLNKYLEKNN